MEEIPEEVIWRQRPPCPHLPTVDRPLTAEWTRAHRGRRDAGFYQASLEYGQSLWMERKPAQAILQLNKAWSAELVGDEDVLVQWPLPYRALLWMLCHLPEGRFVGNPVRHFQHLATRVVGKNAELRSWRAWACFHLSRMVLPSDEFPADALQIERERVVIPKKGEVSAALSGRGLSGESGLFEEIMQDAEGR